MIAFFDDNSPIGQAIKLSLKKTASASIKPPPLSREQQDRAAQGRGNFTVSLSPEDTGGGTEDIEKQRLSQEASAAQARQLKEQEKALAARQQQISDAEKEQLKTLAQHHQGEANKIKSEVEKFRAEAENARKAHEEAVRAAELEKHKAAMAAAVHDAERQMADKMLKMKTEPREAQVPHLLTYGLDRLEKKIGRIRAASAAIRKSAAGRTDAPPPIPGNVTYQGGSGSFDDAGKWKPPVAGPVDMVPTPVATTPQKTVMPEPMPNYTAGSSAKDEAAAAAKARNYAAANKPFKEFSPAAQSNPLGLISNVTRHFTDRGRANPDYTAPISTTPPEVAGKSYTPEQQAKRVAARQALAAEQNRVNSQSGVGNFARAVGDTAKGAVTDPLGTVDSLLRASNPETDAENWAAANPEPSGTLRHMGWSGRKWMNDQVSGVTSNGRLLINAGMVPGRIAGDVARKMADPYMQAMRRGEQISLNPGSILNNLLDYKYDDPNNFNLSDAVGQHITDAKEGLKGFGRNWATAAQFAPGVGTLAGLGVGALSGEDSNFTNSSLGGAKGPESDADIYSRIVNDRSSGAGEDEAGGGRLVFGKPSGGSSRAFSGNSSGWMPPSFKQPSWNSDEPRTVYDPATKQVRSVLPQILDQGDGTELLRQPPGWLKMMMPYMMPNSWNGEQAQQPGSGDALRALMTKVLSGIGQSGAGGLSQYPELAPFAGGGYPY